MELFSKRYDLHQLKTSTLKPGGKENEFIKNRLRKRLQHEIKYIVNSNDYLESFLIVHDENNDEFYLHSSTLSDLSSRELGYDITEIIECETISFYLRSSDDMKLFDLIELLIIFSRKEKRNEFVSRIQTIFSEEGHEFVLHGFMIFKKDETGLRSIMPLIKDRQLKSKLEDCYNLRVGKSNYEALARISADILQRIFSSPLKRKDTKTYTESLCQKVASKWTSKENITELKDLLGESVKNTKLFNNELSNVRHTDKFTIPVASPNFYKLITVNNLSIIELVILSLPEVFVSDQNPEKMKNEHLNKYGLKKENGWVAKKEEKEEIDVKDIPF